MKWIMAELKPGDHIRVKREYYYHHGVYVGDDFVVHYTGVDNDCVSHPNDVSVMKTSLDFFAKEGIVEKASLSMLEKIHKRSNEEAVKLALEAIGTKNYDFLHNNCEDFANRCCYKKTLTSQVNDIKKKI